MIQSILRIFDAGYVYAHCDIPCGIYTTQRADNAAQTVEKMVQKIMELERPSQDAPKIEWQNYHNALSRFIAVKEEWAQICKEELWILWSDYFQNEHLKKFPGLHNTFWKATKLCSANKREVNANTAKSLREAVSEITKIFEATQ